MSGNIDNQFPDKDDQLKPLTDSISGTENSQELNLEDVKSSQTIPEEKIFDQNQELKLKDDIGIKQSDEPKPEISEVAEELKKRELVSAVNLESEQIVDSAHPAEFSLCQKAEEKSQQLFDDCLVSTEGTDLLTGENVEIISHKDNILSTEKEQGPIDKFVEEVSVSHAMDSSLVPKEVTNSDGSSLSAQEDHSLSTESTTDFIKPENLSSLSQEPSKPEDLDFSDRKIETSENLIFSELSATVTPQISLQEPTKDGGSDHESQFEKVQLPSEELLPSKEVSPAKDLSFKEMSPVRDISPKEMSPARELSPKEMSPSRDLSPKEMSPARDVSPRELSPARDVSPRELSPARDLSPKELSPARDLSPKEMSPVRDPSPKELSPVRESPKEMSFVRESPPKEMSPVRDLSPKEMSPVRDLSSRETSPARDPSPKETSPVRDLPLKEPTPPRDPSPLMVVTSTDNEDSVSYNKESTSKVEEVCPPSEKPILEEKVENLSTEASLSHEEQTASSPLVKQEPVTPDHSKEVASEAKAPDAGKPVSAPSTKASVPKSNTSSLIDLFVNLIYWRDVKKTGIVFGSVMVVLLSLTYLSLISVVAYTSLTILTGTIAFRIYKNIMQAVQKSQDGPPFKEFLEMDTNLEVAKVQEATEVAVTHFNSAVSELKRLFLVEDLVDSVKFGCMLWCLTYIGSWFNGLTLVILAVTALFTLPKVYEQNQAQVDQYVGMVRTQVNDVMAKVKAAIPIGNKEKAQ